MLRCRGPVDPRRIQMDFRRLPGSLTSSIPKFIALCVGVAAVVPQTWAESPGPRPSTDKRHFTDGSLVSVIRM